MVPQHPGHRESKITDDSKISRDSGRSGAEV